MAYTYDARSDRYRNTETGRYVTRTQALEFVERSLDSSRDAVSQVSALVGQGDISPSDWHRRMREEIKQEHIRQYLLGRGGRGSMTQADYGSIGGMIADQYRYLNGFYAEVRAGTLTEAQIVTRARMYTNSAREAYERGHRRAIRDTHSEVRWNLGATERHCDDCLDLAARGWIDIDDLDIYPGGGSTQCLTNCDCNLSYQ